MASPRVQEGSVSSDLPHPFENVGSPAAMDGMGGDVIGKTDTPIWIARIVWAECQLNRPCEIPDADALLVDQAS
jgi:hypothetical protein